MTARETMTQCTTYRPQIGSRPGELSTSESQALEAHLAGCEGCRGFANDVAATEWMVSEALLGAAAQRDFAPFVDGVMARVERQRPMPFLERVRRLVRLHPRAVIGSALAPVALALAAVLYLGETGRNDLASASGLEMSAQGVATVIQSADGPVVLLDDDDEET